MLIQLSTISTILFTFVLVFFPGIAFSDQAPVWPIGSRVDLSSGFGDYRPDHFHFGVDIRTGGKIGERVFAPVDGYLYRIRTSYNGYGKALYLKGDDGYIYVFAHLSQFANNLEQYIQKAQTSSRRYEQDIRLPKDSIRVKQSEFIAFSGSTGSGAPHLHFEQRDKENLTLNPLNHGFEINDKTPPTFSRLGYQLIDDKSLFQGGLRKRFVDVRYSADQGYYVLDSVPFFNSPFGLLVDCYDQMRPKGMKQAINTLVLEVDGRELFSRKYDSIDFAVNKSVDLEYDYQESVQKRKRVHRLFRSRFSTFPGSNGVTGLGIPEAPLKTGLHHARIKAEDSYGNRSELRFDFVWSTDPELYELKSREKINKDTTLFVLSPNKSGREIAVDSAVVIRLSRGIWGRTSDPQLKKRADGGFEFKAEGAKKSVHILRLRLYTTTGAVIDDLIFSGILDPGVGIPRLQYDIIDDGLLVYLDITSRRGSRSELDIYYQGKLLDRLSSIMLTASKHVCFVPAVEKFANIDRIDIRLSSDTTNVASSYGSLQIKLYGLGEPEEIKIDRFFSAYIGAENLYQPKFIHTVSEIVPNKAFLKMASERYMIEPDVFLCRKPFQLTYQFPNDVPENKRTGFCWLNPEKKNWVWLESKLSGTQLQGESVGGGVFAVMYDFDPPQISRLSIKDGKRYQQTRPVIRFILEDTLSGIAPDTGIIIEIDGKWLIPEYDPETGYVISRPLDNLSIGRHHLGIRAYDRAGNVAEHYLNFIVTTRENLRGKGR